MPISFQKRAGIAAALITAFGAFGAAAETQEVMILDEAFFPNMIYVEPGDQVRFLNMADSDRQVKALDESWESTLIGLEGSWLYDVTDASTLAFQGFLSDGTTLPGFEGALTFEAPPLSE